MLEQILVGLALVVLGGVVTNVWTRYRNRIIRLRYFVWHNFAGSSMEDPHLGKVEVKYSGTLVKNLYVSTVQLENDGNRDLADLELDIACDDDSTLLTSRAVVPDSLNPLMFTERFSQLVGDGGDEMPVEVWTRRDYRVPVLNRGQRVDIIFLTTNEHGNQPLLTVACDHPGVRMHLAVAKPMLLGEPQQESAWLGSLLALVLCVPIVLFVPNKIVAVVTAAMAGILALLIGIGARKVVRWLARLIG